MGTDQAQEAGDLYDKEAELDLKNRFKKAGMGLFQRHEERHVNTKEAFKEGGRLHCVIVGLLRAARKGGVRDVPLRDLLSEAHEANRLVCHCRSHLLFMVVYFVVFVC